MDNAANIFIGRFNVLTIKWLKPEQRTLKRPLINPNDRDHALKGRGYVPRNAGDRDREFWQNKCNVLEKTIDDAVYKLYDLTPDEIKLVEKG